MLPIPPTLCVINSLTPVNSPRIRLERPAEGSLEDVRLGTNSVRVGRRRHWLRMRSAPQRNLLEPFRRRSVLLTNFILPAMYVRVVSAAWTSAVRMIFFET